MNTAAESAKLVELRAKTDRQLVSMISSRLEAGLSLLRLAADASRKGCAAKAESLELRARQGYEEARKLLPFVRGISWAELCPLERRLEQLREFMEQTHGSTQMRTAC